MHALRASLAAPVAAAAVVLSALVLRRFHVGNAEFVLLAAVLLAATLAVSRRREAFVDGLVNDLLAPKLDRLFLTLEGDGAAPDVKDAELGEERYPGLPPEARARLQREYDRARFLLCTIQRVAPERFQRIAHLLGLGPPVLEAQQEGQEAQQEGQEAQQEGQEGPDGGQDP